MYTKNTISLYMVSYLDVHWSKKIWTETLNY